MKYLATIATVFMVFGYWAQLPVSVYDCIVNGPEVTQEEIDEEDDYYKHCILFTENDNYLFDQNDNKQVTALSEIHIKEDFHAGAFNTNGQMHLKIEEKMDVFSMNQADLEAIPRNDKFELGLDFPPSIKQKMENFFNNSSGDKLSPFDPEDINIEADFYVKHNGVWSSSPVKIFGFYYEEFMDENIGWLPDQSPYTFRIRHTPRIIGEWKCKIKVFINEVETFNLSEFKFKVVPSNLKGFTRVGSNNRYFKIGDEPFFPVGQNLPWPGTGTGNYSNVPEDDIAEFHKYHDDMEDLADAGANYFRFLINPWSTGIEFEELGHYEDRMIGAWETDRILDHARDLGLRIHFNLQVHYPFERVTPTSAIHWDWSAHDALGAYPYCFGHTDDEGYCYSTDLNLLFPEQFLESETAEKFYKMRLRYIISRWGYSPEISVLELFSEANNIGNQARLAGTAPAGCGENGSLAAPYLDDFAQPERVYKWQDKMCKYIKVDLHHTQHPLGVNYTGHPIYFDSEMYAALTGAGCNMLRGDLSYYSDYTDFWTWNSYSYTPERFELHIKHNSYLNTDNSFVMSSNGISIPQIDKLLMYSEIGLTSKCDNDVTWKQVIAISPFDGSSGGFCWENNNTGTTPANIAYRNNLWKTYGYVREFIEGVHLNDDNWHSEYQDRNDNKADLIYLRKPDHPRGAMGAIQNKTVNFYSKRDLINPGDCLKQGLGDDFKAVYKEAQNVQPENGNNKLKIENMGSEILYQIDWYNPFTGEYSQSSITQANYLGTLTLDFPELETDGDSSVVLFKAYPYGLGPFVFLPESPVTEGIPDYLFEDFANSRVDERIEEGGQAVATVPEGLMNSILVVPNPNRGKFQVFFVGEIESLEITDNLGSSVYVGNTPSSGIELDLSDLSSGIYFITLSANNSILTSKIVIE